MWPFLHKHLYVVEIGLGGMGSPWGFKQNSEDSLTNFGGFIVDLYFDKYVYNGIYIYIYIHTLYIYIYTVNRKNQ